MPFVFVVWLTVPVLKSLDSNLFWYGYYASDYSAKEATRSARKKRWLECCNVSMPSPPAACAWPSCVRHALYIVARPDSQFVYTCALFYDILWHEVQSHSNESHIHLTAPRSASALGQAHPMSCIHLVVYR